MVMDSEEILEDVIEDELRREQRKRLNEQGLPMKMD